MLNCGHLDRARRRISFLLITLAVACSDAEDADPYPCITDDDCIQFGAGTLCSNGGCGSPGLTCATSAGIDGAMQAGDGTAAAALGEWLGVGSSIVTKRCEYLDRCGEQGGGSTCYEVGYRVVDATCCEAALSFYLANTDALAACTAWDDLPCGMSFASVCPVLDATPFEELCAAP